MATIEELEQRIIELERRLKTVEGLLRGVSGGANPVRDKFFELDTQLDELRSKLKRIDR